MWRIWFRGCEVGSTTRAPEGVFMAGAVQEKLLDVVRKLVNLTSSANRAEAQAAAYRACVLIRKHGLELVDPSEVDEILKENAALKKQILLAEAVDPGDFSSSYGGQAPPWSGAFPSTSGHYSTSSHYHTRGYQPAAASPPHPRYVAPTPPSSNAATIPYVVVKPPSTSQTQPPSAVPIAAKFSARCKKCGKQMNVGDSILWMKGVGAWCSGMCYTEWVKLSQFNPGVPAP